jgi:UV DNA damage endonuclease
LKSYSEERLIETVENNLNCLEKMLKYNIKKNLYFFRISSDLIPFASHPICKFNWMKYFKHKFEYLGDIILRNKIRISMHPDQFIVINSKNNEVVKRSISELEYHAKVLDLMGLNNDAKIQLHIGGAYDNKKESIDRFIDVYKKLDYYIKSRLVIENDDHIYTLKDCLYLSKKIRIPILFDYFHHTIYNNNEKLIDCFNEIFDTWSENDGIPMIDYSSQKAGYKAGTHADNIDIIDFKNFIKLSKPFNFDIMLEIKDKEKSALMALDIIKNDNRFKKIGL